MSTLRLLLVRHGQTESNVRHVLDSRPPGPDLTDTGRRQARELAERLAAEPVVAVYSSTALRATRTAAALAKPHGLPVAVLDGLHEIFVGDLDGRSDQEALETFYAVFAAWRAGDLTLATPGGESARQLLDRYLPAVDRIRATHQDGVVILVSHGAAMWLAARELAADTVDTTLAWADARLPNCGVITLDVDGDGWRCVSWATEAGQR